MAVISSVALSCGGVAVAQTNSPVTGSAVSSGSSTNVTQLGNITVIGRLNQARSLIVPNLGATAYTETKEQIAAESLGANAPFNDLILRAPGVAQDSAVNGDLHVRGEHANLQYRINDVLLPEGVTGFGLELDPRFVDSMQLITGSLPAQYGFRTAGVVDIHTRTGAFENGGVADLYGGSFGTIKPSFDYGGQQGKWEYFLDGSYEQNDLGIENPTPSDDAIHDHTDQYKTFVYASRLLSDTSRISLMGGASYSDYQVPDTSGLPVGTSPDGTPWANSVPNANTNSADLNENQNEQNYYAIAAYQKSAGDLNLQVAGFGRVSTVHFMPDGNGDLVFNGVASDVKRNLYSGGLQADASYELGDKHTIRGGLMLLEEYLTADTATTVFDVNAGGMPTSGPMTIPDNSDSHALFAGVYLQDEWKILPKVTINYGARFDEYYASFDKENQPSPRVNIIYQPTDSTTLHAGYSRYFTPPPLENVPASTVALYNGTSNASETDQDDPVKAERANYFDAGVSQKLAPGWQAGVDGYYKDAVNQLDDGLFGQTLILSAFNYAEGKVYGVEFTTSYTHGGFSTYANIAVSQAQGKDWSSAQFLFSTNDLAYVKNNWISLDHDQRVTGSFGASYLLKESDKESTLFSVDALYGSGLRQNGGGTYSYQGTSYPIPNGATVPAYYSVNLGVEQDISLHKKQLLKARFDVVNLTDNIYQLRSGTGVGVNAAQYGERLGFFGSLSYVF